MTPTLYQLSYLAIIVGMGGLEPSTFRVSGEYSNQLSYIPNSSLCWIRTNDLRVNSSLLYRWAKREYCTSVRNRTLPTRFWRPVRHLACQTYIKWYWTDSNCWRLPLQGSALPTELQYQNKRGYLSICTPKRIRTSISRFVAECSNPLNYKCIGGAWWTRTTPN